MKKVDKKTYVEALISFLNDPTQSEIELETVDSPFADGKSRYDKYLKIIAYSPNDQLPMVCVYGAHEKNKDVPAKGFKFIGVWITKQQKLVANPASDSFYWLFWPDEIVERVNKNDWMVPYRKAFDQLVSKAREKFKAELEEREKPCNNRLLRAATSHYITGEPVYPMHKFEDYFKQFEENSIENESLGWMYAGIEPVAFATNMVDEALADKHISCQLKTALADEEQFYKELDELRKNVPFQVECARLIYKAIPDKAQNVSVKFEIDGESFGYVRIPSSALRVGETTYYPYSITPVQERDRLMNALSNHSISASMITQIKYRGKTLYERPDQKDKGGQS